LLTQAVFLLGGECLRREMAGNPLLGSLRPAGGIPFLRRLIDEVARFGVEDMILITSDDTQWENFLAENSDRPYRLRPIVPPKEAGTLGVLRFTADLLNRRFFLLDGGSFFDINLLELALEAKPFSVMLALRRAAGEAAERNERARTVNLVENADYLNAGLLAGGVCVVERAILDEFDGLPGSLEGDVFPKLVALGRLGAKTFSSGFWEAREPLTFANSTGSLSDHLRRPALFLDRDGVINVDVGYPHLPDQIQWLDGALGAIRLANDRGYRVVVVTNQAGVARGYYTEETVVSLHRWMQERFAEAGAHVDQFYYCPHHPEAAVPSYRMCCDCRKPLPGMLLRALAGDIRRESSLLVGDKPTDVEAAHRAGIAGHLFPGGDVRDFIDPLLIDWSAQMPGPVSASGTEGVGRSA
jgi:D,D-heptose 1,7-bisphosphate phosphatase